jgi:osmoprotectant transport system ATP-binding protein
MIELRTISKSYGNQTVFQDLDLTFQNGKTYTIIGQSGCGKSTIIRMIAGLVEAESGSIYFNNSELTDSNKNSFRKKIGYVIQDGGLFPHLTAKQNIELQSKYFNYPLDQIQVGLNYLLALTKFSSTLLHKYPSQLSGGEKQRVALMRALMLDPDILLLDEPLGALDPMIRSNLQIELKNIFTKLNKTVVLVTHDLNEAAFFADEIVLLNKGKIEQQDRVDKFFNNPSSDYVTKFISAQRGAQFK